MSKNIIFAPASEAQQAFLTSKSWFTVYGGGVCASV
jgi:hypothetical protein